MPYNYKIEAFCGRDFSRGTTSTTTSCCDIGLVQLATIHRLPTSTRTTMPFETDEAERHGRVLLMLQLRYTSSWTDEAMDDADALHPLYHHHHHAWRTRSED